MNEPLTAVRSVTGLLLVANDARDGLTISPGVRSGFAAGNFTITDAIALEVPTQQGWYAVHCVDPSPLFAIAPANAPPQTSICTLGHFFVEDDGKIRVRKAPEEGGWFLIHDVKA